MALSRLNQRRWRNFKSNRRAYWSLWIFLLLLLVTLPAEFVANDKPILIQYRGGYYMPIFRFYPEVKCLIVTGGLADPCYDDPEKVMEEAKSGTVDGKPIEKGWAIWPPIPHSYDVPVDIPGVAPSPPSWNDLLGTDDTKRDVLARVIYGFRLSILFTLLVTTISSIIGIAAGAIQGYFGGKVDLFFQRFLEVWASTPELYVIIILFAILGRSFWMLVFIICLFGWTRLVGVVRAEFLRARNFEYVRAARALGVSNATIMRRHVLPNAMVATLTLLPFIITGNIATLAGLDLLGFGLPSSAPSLGELTSQAKQNLQAPWLAFTAFFTLASMLSLLVFIFEGVRDAFDPRKTFR
jgi:microcin C transport system permease protein